MQSETPPNVPSGLREVLDAICEGFGGDPYAIEEVFTPDATFQDTPGGEDCTGIDEIATYFTAFGGRRERCRITDVLVDGDRAAIGYVVAFRADARAYAQHGVALVRLDHGRIAEWRGVWVEAEEDLATWGGD